MFHIEQSYEKLIILLQKYYSVSINFLHLIYLSVEINYYYYYYFIEIRIIP